MSIPSKLPVSVVPEAWNSKEAWRVFGIMSEFVSATERLNQIHPA
ncbi:MAG TPA: TIGR00730 family Rossman fold protein, partial [Gallionella sp.]|nr:TIGR00730 family Rossman fold protein [Gallionella sp.]